MMWHPWFITLCGWVVLMGTVSGQTPLDSAFLRRYAETRGFLLGRPVKPKVTPDGKSVLFLRGTATSPKLKLYEWDVTTQKDRELLSSEQLLMGAQEQLTPEEKARRERMRQSAAGLSDYQMSQDGQSLLLPLSGKLYLYERRTQKVIALETGEGTILDPKFSPDGKKIAFVRNHDVCVIDIATKQLTALTTGGTEEKTHGLAEFVAQEEMARFTGYWWSPDSKSIAYEEADAKGVEVWYVADPTKPEQAPHAQYYPRPGKKNVAVRLGIIAITGGETTWVNWPRDTFEYLAQVRWSKQGPMTILVQDRLQQHQQLLRVDPLTGLTSLILEERDPAWLNLHSDIPTWVNDGKQFLWIGEEKTGPMLQLRNADGSIVRTLHEQPGYFADILDTDTKAGIVYISAIVKDGGRQLLGIDWNTGVATPIHPELGATMSGTFGKLFVLTSTDFDHLPRTQVFHPDSKLIGELPSVAEEPKLRLNVVHGTTASGHPFVIVRPQSFDAKKSYPVIVDVYGGPHHLKVAHAMRSWLLMQWLADQGFIVVAMENRGTPMRGRDWERSIYQKLGSVPLEDQVSVLQELGKSHPELDLKRVGMVGWSFGGYMSALAVLKRPDVFRAGVAGAPVTSWEDYDTHYTERYMGLLPESKSAYQQSSLLPLAKDLKQPLLLIHGTADDNVYFRHTLKLNDALFRSGRDFEILPLAGLTHMVPDPVVTERLWIRIAGHFQKHLR